MRRLRLPWGMWNRAFADGNGKVKSTILDSAGQAVSARDGGGFLPSVERVESGN